MLLTGNTTQIKKMNTELVKEAIKKGESKTKATVASMTGLSLATCGTILNELVDTGEAIAVEVEKPNGGRPAVRYSYNAEFKLILCMYLQSEKTIQYLTYQVANMLGEKVEEEKIEYDNIDYDTIDQLAASLIQKYSAICAVGIGVPGIVRDGVIGISDIDSLIGEPLQTRLEEKYNLQVIVDNDVNMIVYGYHSQQEHQGDENIAVVLFGKDYPPGAGIMVNGQIVRGNSNFAGEISFLNYGFSRAEQLEKLKKSSTTLPMTVQAIISVIAVINPSRIMLSGRHFKKEQLEQIYIQCLKHIPEEHMPMIEYKENMDEEYMMGVVRMTLQCLTYHIQLVEKKY